MAAALRQPLQQQIPHNSCFGCGPDNPYGLRFESYWAEDGSTVAEFHPPPWQLGRADALRQRGIIATLLDCHCVCTATAAAYRHQGCDVGTRPHLHYATASLAVRYLRPAPLAADEPLSLEARVVSLDVERIALAATLAAGGSVRAEADVLAARVPESWMRGPRPG